MRSIKNKQQLIEVDMKINLEDKQDLEKVKKLNELWFKSEDILIIVIFYEIHRI